MKINYFFLTGDWGYYCFMKSVTDEMFRMIRGKNAPFLPLTHSISLSPAPNSNMIYPTDKKFRYLTYDRIA